MTRADLLALAARVEAAVPFAGSDYSARLLAANSTGSISILLHGRDVVVIAAALRARAEEASDA